MRLLRSARNLKKKALSSLRRGLSAFNFFEDDGRLTAVLLHFQHACEMLLKSALLQKRIPIFDKKTATTYGFARCANLAEVHCGVAAEQAGVMRAIDSLRDAEQHWFVVVSEELLYLHVRAAVTVFDEILKRVFDDALVNHLPTRVLPLSSVPPAKVDVLMDREYKQINALLAPGRRARGEARGRIRALLALEAHVVEEIDVSEKDINRIEQAIRARKEFAEVFPRLTTLSTTMEGEGIEIKVHFTKKQGAPVRFVAADDPEEAAAVRELDLRKKYRLSPAELAKAVGLTTPKAAALRSHLGLDADASCMHTFEFGRSRFRCYSDNAVRKMKEALKVTSIEEVWVARRARTASRRVL